MPYEQETLAREMALIQELEQQSDRGAAIIGLAWLEESLHEALVSFMTDDKTARDRLFRQSGPLSTFSAKIDLARLLGMCTTTIASDLHILRGIRNEFAHSVLAKDNTALSFDTSHIRDKCLALKCVAHEQLSRPRHAFMRACVTLNSDFYVHKLIGEKVAGGGQVFAAIEDETRMWPHRNAS